jgi:hypothetical protein
MEKWWWKQCFLIVVEKSLYASLSALTETVTCFSPGAKKEGGGPQSVVARSKESK